MEMVWVLMVILPYAVMSSKVQFFSDTNRAVEKEFTSNGEKCFVHGDRSYILTLIASEYYNVTIVNEDQLDDLLESCDQNRTPNEHVDHVLRKKRNAIFPGTNWCGTGNIAKNFDDLNVYNETDACCRAHDQCDLSIPPFTSRYGLTNVAIWYSNHCSCDDQFYTCLKASTDEAAQSVGNLYFNFLHIDCIEETGSEVSTCVDWGWFRLWCNEYVKEPGMKWRKPKSF